MDLGIRNRIALVTGAGGGLGGAIALALANEGAKVVVADINPAALEAVANRVREAGAEVMSLEWDLSDLGVIDARIDAIEQRFGTVDILVNNTGGPPPTPASGQPADLWERHFRSMVLSVIGITDRVLPGMKEKHWGRVVTSASSGVVAPIAGLAVSNALRMSLVGWSKTLAREVGRDGITANLVVPGRIGTDRIRFLDESKAKREGRTVEEVSTESTGSIPLGRYGRPEEYAQAVAFLASEAASYVTGSIMRVDGGLIASV
ncbi:SDR family oxidoreductase [Paraburkholderia caledonica]|uniref:3-oxoacyl-[acyl-carrier protein] reductase n=1 Tax=Paraburkholderia caledonica TaxID=134536 RepID=A0ABU1L0M4_9BURK|nr:SDR family oxidoreductase [Paraburkholderia caledonica]MDR6376784.1 3-oxoacyl-[acyl-carrier protein] reductase [Paraburkholderia caledonica]